MRKRLFRTVLTVGMLAGLLALPATAQAVEDDSIAGVASSSNQFNVLVDLVVEAGLLDALSETGDDGVAMTVFAPNDTAFRRLVYELERANGERWFKALKTAWRSSEASIADYIVDATGGADGLLDEVLKYHIVVDGAFPFDVAKTLEPTPVNTLLGPTVTVDGFRNRSVRVIDNNDVLMLGGDRSRSAWVYRSLRDIAAGDDIIHGINRVILP